MIYSIIGWLVCAAVVAAWVMSAPIMGDENGTIDNP